MVSEHIVRYKCMTNLLFKIATPSFCSCLLPLRSILFPVVNTWKDSVHVTNFSNCRRRRPWGTPTEFVSDLAGGLAHGRHSLRLSVINIRGLSPKTSPDFWALTVFFTCFCVCEIKGKLFLIVKSLIPINNQVTIASMPSFQFSDMINHTVKYFEEEVSIHASYSWGFGGSHLICWVHPIELVLFLLYLLAIAWRDEMWNVNLSLAFVLPSPIAKYIKELCCLLSQLCCFLVWKCLNMLLNLTRKLITPRVILL